MNRWKCMAYNCCREGGYSSTTINTININKIEYLYNRQMKGRRGSFERVSP